MKYEKDSTMYRQEKTLGLFPGQGAYYAGASRGATSLFPEVRQTFEDIDGPARELLGVDIHQVMFEGKPLSLAALLKTNPQELQLAMFGVSVSLYRILRNRGVEPDILMGHSFGEIAALTCAESFSVQEGAEIVCHRVLALQDYAITDGAMAALALSVVRARGLVELIGKDLSVAVVNHPNQTVVSGSAEAMAAVQRLADSLQLSCIPVQSPYAFHSPLLEAAAVEFYRRIDSISARTPRVPVYSPILGRFYNADDRLTQCLAGHLVECVDFQAAVEVLSLHGITRTVELGASETLTRIVRRNLSKQHDVSLVAPLSGPENEVATLQEAIDQLSRTTTSVSADQARCLLPNTDPVMFADFWHLNGQEIVSRAQEQFMAFSRDAEVAALATANPAIAEGAAVAASNGHQQVAPTPATAGSRDQLYRELVKIYADALEYPTEAFSETVELEAELGIDSVKQTELFTRVAEAYSLPERPDDFRLGDFPTMGSIVDFVVSYHGRDAAPAALDAGLGPHPVSPVEAESATSSHDGSPSREELFQQLAGMYAVSLEYPAEVFTEEVELEAELGIDSVKQTELLTRVAEQFAMPERPESFRMSDYTTMGKVVDFVFDFVSGRSPVAVPT